ncbi:hypothetical protein AtEden1_Chr2g0231971 [Arabidopsis thaliana]
MGAFENILMKFLLDDIIKSGEGCKKLLKFGDVSFINMKKQIEQVKHFLETMPNLEQMMLYYDTP